jgi:two-component system chemotaxis response regulator CheB
VRPEKLVAIGGSAGSFEALQTIIGDLPANLPAAMLVVVHLPPSGQSRLPDLLGRAGRLPAQPATHGAALQAGHVYVAPPDYHLLVRDGQMALGRGPRENHSRPAIDPFFRSAARAYGPQLMAVLLSGSLSDGTLGLMAVNAHGGLCVVQDPAEALVTSMPSSAIEAGVVHRVLPAAEIAPAIIEFARGAPRTGGVDPMASEVERAPNIIAQDIADQENGDRHGQPSLYSCPDCGGVMWQVNEGEVFHFYCHLGHSLSPDVLMALKSEELEDALWNAVRTLREKAMLTRQMAGNARAAGRDELADRLDEQADSDVRSLNLIRDKLLGGAESPITETQEIDAEPGPS